MDDLNVRISGDGTTRVVHLEGACDLASVPRLREILAPLVPPEVDELVVDLSQLQVLDDTGMGVLLGALRRQRQRGGRMKVAGATGRVLEAFRITGLVDIIPMFEDASAATGGTDERIR